jgi:oleate hydratase
MGDLMSRVPALKKQNKTVKDKFIKFNEKNNVIFESRLIKNKKVLDARPLKISVKNRLKLSSLLLIPESTLHNKKISEYFSPDFYESNFWYEFCTVFGFTPENSLIEFKRYVTRFLHCSKYYDNLDPAIITPLNQYESVILPILDWLKEEGVNFEPETKITNVDFETVNNMKKIVKIYLKKDPNNKEKEITVKKDDYVFMTI